MDEYAPVTTALEIGSETQKTMATNKHTTETMNPNPKNNRAASYTDAMKLEVVKRCVLSPVFVYIDAPNIIPWGRGHSYQGLRVGFSQTRVSPG